MTGLLPVFMDLGELATTTTYWRKLANRELFFGYVRTEVTRLDIRGRTHIEREDIDFFSANGVVHGPLPPQHRFGRLALDTKQGDIGLERIPLGPRSEQPQIDLDEKPHKEAQAPREFEHANRIEAP
ncbi:MAG: hypothetical protein JSV19_10170, partial [Phycisphaerales bacterium]